MKRPDQPVPAPSWMAERFRPAYHYTAEKNMINDPNGLLYHDGEWHLFHQYNQHEVVHWGHAVSTDLVRWTHLPPAISPDHNGQIYSGTAVVDTFNTSGLQRGTESVFVAFFTHADHHDGTQSQGLAYSNDRGRTWTMHPNNPIVANPGPRDFRDPKVLRHHRTNSWIMIVTLGHQLQFYRSPDLITWTPGGVWGKEHGAHGGLWECPDLFPLRIQGTDETRWVLSVSVSDGAPAGGSGMQYFIGDFDGYTFTNHNAPTTVLWHDHGKDFYAGITWENVPAHDGRRLMIAWTDNWQYRFDIPTTPFNGQLTTVRELRLHDLPDGLRLSHQPIGELQTLRQPPTTLAETIVGPQPQPIDNNRSQHYELEIRFDLTRSTAADFGLELFAGTQEQVRHGYQAATRTVYLDRTNQLENPHHDYRVVQHVRQPAADNLDLHVLVDKSSVEVFINHRDQITALSLPQPGSTGLRLFAEDGYSAVTTATIWPLDPIWRHRRTPLQEVHSGDWALTSSGITGSSTGTGEATLSMSPERSWECTIEIVGTTPTNPIAVLGEHAAGLSWGTEELGLTAVLNHVAQTVELRSRPTGRVLAAAPFPIAVNTAYRLRVHHHRTMVEVCCNDQRMLKHLTSIPDDSPMGLLVHNAEAVFTHPQPVRRAGLATHRSGDRPPCGHQFQLG